MNSHSSQSTRGTLPATQARSQRNREKLLGAGRSAVESRNWDEVSIEALAKAAGCSVGTFYQRYQNKDALLLALIAEMLKEARAASDAIYDGNSGAKLIDGLVSQAVSNFRQNAGLLRAAARKAIENPEFWSPVKDFGVESRAALVAHFRAQGKLSRAGETQLRFAHQMMVSTLVNTLINRPDAMALQTRAFESELTRAFATLVKQAVSAE